MKPPRLIIITDSSLSDDELVARADASLAAASPGEVALQLRDKARPARHVLSLAERLAEVCERRGALLMVNDRIDVAQAVAARGIHLGGGSVDVGDAREALGPAAFVSVAAHQGEDLTAARYEGADAILLSPIFPSPGKGPALGVQALVAARAASPSARIYALGGVEPANAPACLAAGAAGVAVIRAVLHAKDCALAVRAFLGRLR